MILTIYVAVSCPPQSGIGTRIVSTTGAMAQLYILTRYLIGHTQHNFIPLTSFLQKRR
jgi:hypothetical protein